MGIMTKHRTAPARLRAAAAAVALTALAPLALAVTTATPAQADTAHCTAYLAKVGYSVGDKTKAACAVGSRPGGTTACRKHLSRLDVIPRHYKQACALAAR